MVKKLTITVDEDVYEGYRAMAADGPRETEVEEWAEALIGDVTDGER